MLYPNSMKLIGRWRSNQTAWVRELLHANASELAQIRASWTSVACQRDKKRCLLGLSGTRVPVSSPNSHSSCTRIGLNAIRLWWTSTQDLRALRLFSTRADLACKVTTCSKIKWWRVAEHRVMVGSRFSDLSPQALLRPSSLWKKSCPRSMTCPADSPTLSSGSYSLLETSSRTKFKERTAALSTTLLLKRSMGTWQAAICHRLAQPVRPIKSGER